MTDDIDGWVFSPNNRGTFDILWSCAQTMALCGWVSVCVNLPTPEDGCFGKFMNKFCFTLTTLLGPEIVFMVAYCQYLSAKASVRDFRNAGYSDWTLSHAFYADLGGITVQPPNWKRFPVNAKQLFYLVDHQYMPYPTLSLQDITCCGRTDNLGRLVTIVQALYFTITTLARVLQGLAITTLELTVLGFVFGMFTTTICWWHKPKDVESGRVFELNTEIQEIIIAADKRCEGRYGYRNTPLDFISDEPWAPQVMCNFYVNILYELGISRSSNPTRPVQRFSSFTSPKPSPQKGPELIALVQALLYLSIFLAAWNFRFPSFAEHLLWRIISAAQLAIWALAAAFEMAFAEYPGPRNSPDTPLSRLDLEKVESQSPRLQGRCGWLRRVWNRPYNNSVGQHPYYNVPLRSVVITMPLGAAYIFCRCYLLIEDIIGLRSQPSSSYQTVDWTQFLPSF